MNQNCKTTSSSLFNNTPKVQIASWLDDLCNVEVKEKESLDLDFETTALFGENKISTDNKQYNVSRELKNNVNLEMDAKKELSKFLSGYKYRILNENKDDNSICLELILEDYPYYKFIFTYGVDDGLTKTNFVVKNGDTEEAFTYNKIGLGDALEFISTNKTKITPMKIEAANKYSLMNKEEIVRRFNNKLRDAQDAIDNYLKDDVIMGVSSNTYASIYDMEYLFPKVEELVDIERADAVQFIKNVEHVAAKQYKSKEQLVVEACNKFINDDIDIIDSDLTNNQLTISYNKVSNGLTTKCAAKFNVSDGKLDMVENKSDIENIGTYNWDVINKFSNDKLGTKKIYDINDIKNKLKNVISASKIDDVIKNIFNNENCTPISNTKFATNMTFADLIKNIDSDCNITVDELDEIKEYSKLTDSEIIREDYVENDIQDIRNIDNSETMLLNKAREYVSNIVKDVKFGDYTVENDAITYNTSLFDEESGLHLQMSIVLYNDGKNITKCAAKINDKLESMDKVKEAFLKNEVLSKYIVSNNKNENSNIIISYNQLINKLNKIANISQDNINELITNWENNGSINKLSDKIFGSKYTIAELINKSNLKALNDEQVNFINEKSRVSKDKIVKSCHIKDNDTRELIYENSEVEFSNVLEKINKICKINSYDFDRQNNIINANIINPNNINQNISFRFKDDNIYASINDKEVDINNIADLYYTNDSVELYNKYNKDNSNKLVVSKKSIVSKLNNLYKNETIDEILKIAVNNNLLKPINNSTFVTIGSIQDILYFVNKDIDKEAEEISDVRKLDIESKQFASDNSRELINDNTVEKDTFNKLASDLLNEVENNTSITEFSKNKLKEKISLVNNVNEINQLYKEYKDYIKVD